MTQSNNFDVILLSDITDVIAMEKTLGPFKVASELRRHGFRVAVIHHLSVFHPDEILQILDQLITDRTLFVGVNNFFYKQPRPFQSQHEAVVLEATANGSILPHGIAYNDAVLDVIRSRNPKCQLVLGGPTGADVSHNRFFDFVVLGYSEKSVINLARHLRDGDELHHAYRSVFGFTVIDDSRAKGYDFASSNTTYDITDGVLPGETLTLEVARGCIFKCAFCSYPMNGKKKLDYIRTKQSLRRELLDNYDRFGTTRYMIIDDTLNDSPEKCQLLCDIAEELPFQLEWWAYLRLDLMAAHPHTIDLLWRGGMRATFYGIETLNARTASAIGKGGNRQRLIDTILTIKQRYGDSISQHGSFIYGLPYEDIRSLEETTQWLLSHDNPLDSWQCLPLMIRDSATLGRNNDFISDIDRNWASYGYEDTGGRNSNYIKEGTFAWRNAHTNFEHVARWTRDIESQGRKQKNRLPGRSALAIAGLGVDLAQILNKSYDDIDWNFLDRAKMSRALEYKQLIYRELGLTLPQTEPTCDTFSAYLQQRIGDCT